MVDVVDHDRPALRGHAAREATPDRDADAALDLLLDPVRRPRDQLVAAVSSSRIAHVSASRIARTRVEQLVEQRVEPEVRERHVRDLLQLQQPFGERALGLVDAAVLDRERRPVGRQLEQVHVPVGELAGRERADVDDPDHVAVDEQRHAQERLDALLAQDRVEDVAVVDVRDDHRPPLGRDLAREALADGDPDALLDLLLDPARRARDELVRRLVEQEEGARVAVERVADPVEQRLQQVAERQVRERRIGDGLDPPELVGRAFVGCQVRAFARAHASVVAIRRVATPRRAARGTSRPPRRGIRRRT